MVLPRVPLLRSSMAVCTASVVAPAPPTAGRKVKICASIFSAWAATLATRAQVRTSSAGGTGLTRKSATRICTRRRAVVASKLPVTATTGGQLPRRVMRFSSACNSASSPASTSTMTRVLPSTSIWSRLDSVPLTTSRPSWPLAPNAARTASSNALSAVKTTTLAWTRSRYRSTDAHEFKFALEFSPSLATDLRRRSGCRRRSRRRRGGLCRLRRLLRVRDI